MSEANRKLIPGELQPRLAARAIDFILLAAIGGTIGWLIGFRYDWLVLTAALVLLYFVAADVTAGATAGKAVFGLRVIGPDGGRLSVKQALQREWFILLGAVPFVGPPLAFGAWLWIAMTIRWSPLRQGRHEMLAGGARVIRVN
jgi:uncharacterized RDD family membrane protein YckC